MADKLLKKFNNSKNELTKIEKNNGRDKKCVDNFFK